MHFECSNLQGYDAAKALCDEKGSFTIHEVCASAILSQAEPWASTGLNAAAYSTDPLVDTHHLDSHGLPDGYKHPYTVTADPEWYDVHSIMHYPSKTSWNPDKGWSVRGVPLVRWKKGNKNFKPPKEINDGNAEIIDIWNPLTPTEKDVAIVKALYPWETTGESR